MMDIDDFLDRLTVIKGVEYLIAENLFTPVTAMFRHYYSEAKDIAAINLIVNQYTKFGLLIPAKIKSVRFTNNDIYFYPSENSVNEYPLGTYSSRKSEEWLNRMFPTFESCLEACSKVNEVMTWEGRNSLHKYLSVIKELIYEAEVRWKYYRDIAPYCS